MTYPLYAFDAGNTLIYTRGSTPERAAGYIQRFRPEAKLLPFVPLDAPAWYLTNHSEGWLHRKPVYEMQLDGEPWP